MGFIGSRLRELRTQNGLNKRELADIIQVHPATISHLECNRRIPTLDVAIRLAKLFDISLDELIDTSEIANQKVLA